jgi:hypothetical protein
LLVTHKNPIKKIPYNLILLNRIQEFKMATSNGLKLKASVRNSRYGPSVLEIIPKQKFCY